MPPTWRTTWFVKLENVRKGCVLLFSTENSTFTSGDQHNAPVKMLSLFRKSTVFSWHQLMCHLRCPSIPSSTVAEVNKRDSCDAGSGGLTCDSVGLSNFVRESIISDLESLREAKEKHHQVLRQMRAQKKGGRYKSTETEPEWQLQLPLCPEDLLLQEAEVDPERQRAQVRRPWIGGNLPRVFVGKFLLISFCLKGFPPQDFSKTLGGAP